MANGKFLSAISASSPEGSLIIGRQRQSDNCPEQFLVGRFEQTEIEDYRSKPD